MKTSVTRILSMVMVVAMISCLSCVMTFAQPSGLLRSSNYLDAYSADVSAASGGRIIVGVSVDALGYMTQVGASSITVYKSSDQINWYPVKTYSYTDYPSMMTSGYYYFADAVTYYGTPGYYYMAIVTCYAGNANGHDSRPYTTNGTRAIS